MPGVRFLAGIGIFFFRQCVQTGFGDHPASYQMGTRVIFSAVKRAERGADHSPPSSTEVMNAWSYTSTPLYVIMEWCLIKYRIRFHGMVFC
jgi:hypothetical protein